MSSADPGPPLLQLEPRRRRTRLFASLATLILLAALALLGARALTGHEHHAHAHPTVAARPHEKTVTAADGYSIPAGYAETDASTTLQATVRRDLRRTVIDTKPLKSGLLFDVRTGKVLWSRDPTKVVPIASLTKLMTALLVVAHSSTADKVLITKQAIDYTGSGVGVLPLGKRVSERALLYGLLLPSGNDAAIALAQHVAGTQSRFIAMMNREARALDLGCTHYTTESGVVDQGNHSCAVDLAQLAHIVLTNRILAPIVATGQITLKFPIRGGRLYLYNNNPLLEAGYPGTVGVKTGYTEAAGMCLIAAVRRGNRWLGIVLLHSANWLTQAKALLNAGFAATAPQTVGQ